ncbi:helix-turn-helix transcriptional regulator [Roseicyclus persicicus]|uniref:helix-turn-helix transcriptional regulator n=1 Tax=Roseicyclus persicicus TaxID=2650661 RepID=UPI0030841DF8
MFELVQLFRGGRLWRGADLAERLGVSLRTLYRDIDRLVASGVPIEGERGVGYVLRVPVFLPPLTLTTAELEALHLGLALVARSGDATLAQAADGLRGKVDAVLPDARQGRDYAAGTTIHAPAPEGALAMLPGLRAAIRDRQVLSLVYTALDGAETRREVWPLHLEFWGRAWTLTAWCALRADFRAFRVDRIARLTPTGAVYPDRPGRRYADYLAAMG